MLVFLTKTQSFLKEMLVFFDINGTEPHKSLDMPSLSLLLTASAASLSVLSRAWDWGVLKGSKLCSWGKKQQHLYSADLHFNTKFFPGFILRRA
jgi:hypothetical protein